MELVDETKANPTRFDITKVRASRSLGFGFQSMVPSEANVKAKTKIVI